VAVADLPLPLHIQEPGDPDALLVDVIRRAHIFLGVGQAAGSEYIARRVARDVEAVFTLIRTEDVIGG
jgi:hypothetical protein